MSRHLPSYGTYEGHYYTGPNYDEGVGAFEFGVWHTQYREGLIAAPGFVSGVYGARIPPGYTEVGDHPARGVEPVRVKPAPKAREPKRMVSAPKPTPEAPPEGGGGKPKKTVKPKPKSSENSPAWLRLVSGGFRRG